MSKLSIKVRIANKEYPLKIEAEAEEQIRKAAKTLQKKIKTYQEQLGVFDNQDLLALIAFDEIFEKLKAEEHNSSTSESILKKIINLNQLVSSHL